MLIEFSFSNVFTISFIGMLIYQCFLSFFKYTLNKQREYLFYTIYLLILIINFSGNFFFWLNQNLLDDIGYKLLKYLFGYPINFLIQIIYLFFLKEYLHTKQVNQKLDNQLKQLIFANVAIEIISLIYFVLNPNLTYWAEIIFNGINFVLFLIPLYLVIKSKIVYYKFIVVGTIFLGIGLVANLILSITAFGDFDYDITIMIGVLIEIIIFNYGIQLKIENQGKALLVAELEKQKAIENEHKRMSADLHDEVGSTLSSIQIMSVISRKKLDTDLVEAKKILLQINDQSKKMQHSLSDIVWGLRSDLNSVDDLVIKMKEILSYTLEPSQIEYEINLDDNISDITLSVKERRSILLIFKEAINNIIKYAEAKHVVLSFKKVTNSLNMLIKDNGKGFNYSNKNNTGNGLTNIQNRAQQINALLKIESVVNVGTSIYIKLPIKKLH